MNNTQILTEQIIISINLSVNRQFVYPRAVFHLTAYLMRLSATSPNAASVRHWLNQGCQVCCSLPEHYQCNPAHWHGTISKTIACLTSQNPNNDI